MEENILKEEKLVKEKIPLDEETAFIERIIFINRITKVTKGGKNLNFSALVSVGDGKGRVGFGLGKAPEVAEAIRKGINLAKKNLISIPLVRATIPFEVIGKFGAVEVLLKPAGEGTGVIACLPIRSICECAGIKNILTKVLTKSNNPINVVKATFEALSQLR